MKKQLLWGSFTGTLQIVINTILIFTVIPVFINKLGLQAFSIFSLLLLFNNLNVFMNLGLNNSLVKHIAEQGKSRESNFDIVVSFVLLLLIVIPFSVLAILLNEIILINLFGIEPVFITTETIYLFNSIVISNCFLLLGQIFTAVLDAQQKVYLNNFALILYNISYWGLILISLLNYPGFQSIGNSIFISTLIWFVLVFILFIKTWGIIEIHDLRNNLIRILKKQLKYGSKLYFSGSISFLHEPLTKLLISHFIGLNEVAFFDIALRIKNQIWNLISRVFYPIFPLISKMNDKNSIKNLIHTIEQKTIFIIVPIIMSVIFISNPFVAIWIGNNVGIISITMILITCSYLIATTIIPTYQFLMAKGYPEKTIIIQVVNVIMNGSLFFIALPFLGYYSAVIGNVGAILSSFLVTLFYQKKYLNCLILDNFKQLANLLLVVTINVIIGSVFSMIIDSYILKIILTPIILIISSIFAFRTLKIFTKEEIRKFSDRENLLIKVADKILIRSS